MINEMGPSQNVSLEGSRVFAKLPVTPAYSSEGMRFFGCTYVEREGFGLEEMRRAFVEALDNTAALMVYSHYYLGGPYPFGRKVGDNKLEIHLDAQVKHLPRIVEGALPPSALDLTNIGTYSGQTIEADLDKVSIRLLGRPARLPLAAINPGERRYLFVCYFNIDYEPEA